MPNNDPTFDQRWQGIHDVYNNEYNHILEYLKRPPPGMPDHGPFTFDRFNHLGSIFNTMAPEPKVKDPFESFPDELPSGDVVSTSPAWTSPFGKYYPKIQLHGRIDPYEPSKEHDI